MIKLTAVAIDIEGERIQVEGDGKELYLDAWWPTIVLSIDHGATLVSSGGNMSFVVSEPASEIADLIWTEKQNL